jgi:hypothetical protein
MHEDRQTFQMQPEEEEEERRKKERKKEDDDNEWGKGRNTFTPLFSLFPFSLPTCLLP